MTSICVRVKLVNCHQVSERRSSKTKPEPRVPKTATQSGFPVNNRFGVYILRRMLQR